VRPESLEREITVTSIDHADLKEVSMQRCVLLSRISILAIRTIVVSSLVLAASTVWANDGDRQCSNRTLSGDYGCEVRGLLLPAPGVSIEFRGLTMTHFNGDGGVTAMESIVVGGNLVSPNWVQSSGNYTVNPDCTGTETSNTPLSPVPIHLQLVVVDNGKKSFLVNDAHALLTTCIKVGSADRDE
jgi:hypothetical protein